MNSVGATHSVHHEGAVLVAWGAQLLTLWGHTLTPLSPSALIRTPKARVGEGTRLGVPDDRLLVRRIKTSLGAFHQKLLLELRLEERPPHLQPVVQTGLRGEVPCPTFPGGVEMEPGGSKEGLPVGKVEEPPCD